MTEYTKSVKPFVLFNIPEEPYVEEDEDLKILQSIQGPNFKVPWDTFVVVDNSSIAEFWTDALGAPAMPVVSSTPTEKTVTFVHNGTGEKEDIEVEFFYLDVTQLDDQQLYAVAETMAKAAHLNIREVLQTIATQGLPILAAHVNVYEQAKGPDDLPIGIRAEVAVNHSAQAQYQHDTALYLN